MALNIKNERVIKLARRCAEATGASQVSVVEAALIEYLAKIERDGEDSRDRQQRLLETVWLSVDGDAPLSTDSLYDEQGLPA